MKLVYFLLFIIMFSLNVFNEKIIAQKNEINMIDWSIFATLPEANAVKKQLGIAGPVVGVSNNVLIVAGGANFPNGMPWNGAKKVYQDEIYLVEKENETFSVSLSKQKMPQAIAYSANVTTPDGIYFLGGENEMGLSDRVTRINYNQLTGEISFFDLQSLPMQLSNLSAVFFNNKIYIAGGDGKEETSNQFFSLDLLAPSAKWQKLPEIPVKIAYTVMLVQSNNHTDCIYLFGGRSRNRNGISDIYTSVYRFNLENNKWSQMKSLPSKLSASTGIAMGTNKILLFSGDKGEIFSKVEKLNLAISLENDDSKKQEMIKEKIALLNAHPGFIKDVLLYDTQTDTFQLVGTIPFDAPVTTTAVLWDEYIIIPSGEIRAGIRTTNILTGKLSGIFK